MGSRSGGVGGGAGGAGRECIFPEMPRTKHVGQATHSGKGWLTTSASAQHMWFDLMALNRDSSSVCVCERESSWTLWPSTVTAHRLLPLARASPRGDCSLLRMLTYVNVCLRNVEVRCYVC